MNEKVKEFTAFEKKRKLFKRRYLGVPYWQSCRMFLLSDILQTKQHTGKCCFSDKLLLGIKIFRDFTVDFIKYVSLSKCDILYFDGCSYRIIDGESVDPYFDYFDFEKKYRVQRCFHIYGRQKKTSLAGIGTVIPRVFEYVLNLCSGMAMGFDRDKKEERFLEKLALKLEDDFHAGLTSYEFIQIVRKNVRIHKIYNKYYEKLILKCKPKAIFVVCHYNGYLFPLYSAARKYGIPVIELQHGQIMNHEAYWYEDTTSTGKELPDYFFTYGSFWSEDIKLPENMKIVPIGNPFLENRKKTYQTCVQNEKMMVFYSSRLAAKEMEQLAVDAWNYFGKKGYQIFFKIHPLEYDGWKEQYQLLNKYPQIHVVTPDIDLYKLLSCAKHHITYASTVFYEAAVFENNRYIYELGNLGDSLQPLVDLKLAYKFKTIKQLAQMLDMSMGSIWDHESEIWMKEAKRNGQVKLREIIHGQKYKNKR